MITMIDLVYPCHSKDISTIDICIKYARLNIQNLNNIYVVSKTKLTDNAIWISEDAFPFTFQDMIDVIGDHWRTGWYYAGWIHLQSSICIPNILDNVLISDADTVFIRPVSFIDDEGKALFNLSPSDGTPLYFEHMNKLIPGLTPQIKPPWSGVAHHILMNKTILKHMMNVAEEKHGIPFWKAWINVTLESYKSSSCEHNPNKHRDGPGRATSYELYFNYAMKYFPDSVKVRKLDSIMSYKGFLNVKNDNYKEAEGSRTNLRGNKYTVIPKEEELKVTFETFIECLEFHIQKCIEAGFDNVTFQNHQRDGLGIHKEKASVEKR